MENEFENCKIEKVKIVTIIGARPQFIKAGTVSRIISEYPDVEEIIVHTGQHYDANMNDIFFEEMRIPKPHYFLEVGSKSHGAMTGQMMEKIELVVLKEKPDWILVYGDTNSTLAGALVASKLHVKLAHVEAGLRSFNMEMPEEINRILTDRVSDVLFCPTDQAIENLKLEGYENFNCSLVKSGDVMFDGALFYSKFAKKPHLEIADHYVLATVHRAENTDSPEKLKSIILALNEIHKTRQVILPLHPRTKNVINQNNIEVYFNVVDPVGYLEMIWLIQNSDLVITDSGGLQKEAYFFKKQCITLREQTEWLELVSGGFNILTGHSFTKIISAFCDVKVFNDSIPGLYGNGNASKNIIEYLRNFEKNKISKN